MRMVCYNKIVKIRFCGKLLITCRFLVIFLVVSRKKRIFAAEVERLIENKMEQTVFNPAQKKILDRKSVGRERVC